MLCFQPKEGKLFDSQLSKRESLKTKTENSTIVNSVMLVTAGNNVVWR